MVWLAEPPPDAKAAEAIGVRRWDWSAVVSQTDTVVAAAAGGAVIPTRVPLTRAAVPREAAMSLLRDMAFPWVGGVAGSCRREAVGAGPPEVRGDRRV